MKKCSCQVSVWGVNSAKGQDSSVGGGAGNVCLGVCPHERRGSGHSTGRSGKRRSRYRRDTRKGTTRGTEREQTISQPLTMDDHGYGVMRTNTILSHVVWHTSFSVRTVQEKNDVWSVPVYTHRRLQWIATVNETNCNKKKDEVTSKKIFMSSTNFWTCLTRNRLRKSAISCIAVEKLVLQFPYLNHDDDGFWERDYSSKIWSKSHKRVLAWLIQGEIPLKRWYVWSCFANSSISMHVCSVQPIASCESR